MLRRTYTRGQFEPENHYYTRVLNAQLHPLVRYFLSLDNERITSRYCHLNPQVQPESVMSALEYRSKHFFWGGTDLFPTTDERGRRRLVIIETNSCPSGQKSMPYVQEHVEQGGYRTLLERAFVPRLRRRGLPSGGLCVLYDKNPMEASGYAAVLSDLMGEPVQLVPFKEGSDAVRFTEEGVLEVRDEEAGAWAPMRAALRYVTQQPWNRIPAVCKTLIFNPVLVCLAGGRNKLLASKAYDLHNASLDRTGLQIRTPETIWDVSLNEVPLWIERMGGVAVIKVPYSNAGQGVYTITNAAELERFMEREHRYDRFIVQSLIGNVGWSSRSKQGRLYHLGTLPDRKNHLYVADLRFMVGSGEEGFFPVAIYARRAREPLKRSLEEGEDSWSILGTNLSYLREDGSWDTQTERLVLMDSRDFNRLGLGIDDLIEAYIQTVLAVTAIDQLGKKLLTKRGRFRRKLFQSMNPDPRFVGEVLTT